MAEPQAIPAQSTDYPIRTASASGQTLSLPLWESFAHRDRQQLVQTILQAAQRQLTGTAARSMRESGR